MALNKELLKNNLNNIFDLNTTAINNIDQIAELLTNIIVDYLKDVQLKPIEKPGYILAHNDTPSIIDINFRSNFLFLNNSIDNFSFLLKNAIKNDMEFNLNNNSIPNWNNSNIAFNNFVESVFNNFRTEDDYIVVGNTTPGIISLSIPFNKFKKNSEEIATTLSNHLHQYFTNCIFTGTYSKETLIGTFVGIEPHISNLI